MQQNADLQDFTDHSFLSGNFGPVLQELDLPDLPVLGTIPREISGALYRNGPNPQFPPRDAYHWFAGDGMVHAFFIDEGQVGYSNRWVRTPKWQVENKAGKTLFGAFGNPMTTDPDFIGSDSGLANTNIVWHGNRLLALEEGHAPTELDPIDLKTKGYFDFQDNPVSRVTAHPKFDPETGEMVFFAYSLEDWFSKKIGYYVADRNGKLTRSDLFEAPYSAMIHDFMVTRNYVMFPLLPLTGDLERAANGGPPFAWEPERGAFVGILRRDRPIEELRWIEIDPCYVFHPVNAYEVGDEIIAEVLQYDAPPLFPRPDGTSLEDVDTSANLTRWRLSPDQPDQKVRRERLDNLPGEFPRFDERLSGLRHQFSWYAYQVGTGPDLYFNSLCLYDNESGQRQTYELPSEDGISEPIFVPRQQNAPEADGYVLAVAYRTQEDRSDLLIFEALDISAGPIATVQLPCRVPFGFHGNWRQN